jgi:hypothetical protein
MGIGDMLQAERDAEDGARYRWLKAQFELEMAKRERQELVSQKGNRTTYEAHTEVWCIFRLKDDWRFGETRDVGAGAPEFDKLVDALRAERTTGD